nr:glycosyltransferase family 4 protein [Frondihabitans sp. VKM Ac-2883]
MHQYFRTPEQSGGVRSYHFARALAERGHDVHVVTSRIDRQQTRHRARGFQVDLVDGLTVHSLAIPYSNAMPFTRRMKAFASFAIRSSRRARKIRGDVVVATSTPLTIAVPGIVATARRGAPLVFEVRDVWPELPIALGALSNPFLQFAARRLEKAAYRASSTVIALSPGMKSGVVRAGYPADRVEVITNVSDTAAFAPHSSNPEEFLADNHFLKGRKLIVYCGTFGLANDVGYLVDVAEAARARGDDLTFVAIGEGSEKDAVRERAACSGVLNRNFFLFDVLPKGRLPGVLASATIVLSLFADIPELESNSANKFFDALAAQKPVAVNYGGWQAETLERTKAGIRLPRDANAAASALFDAASDSTFLAVAKEAAAHLAATEFSLERLSSRFCDIVERDAAEAGTA